MAQARALLGERTSKLPRSPTAWGHLARVLFALGEVRTLLGRVLMRWLLMVFFISLFVLSGRIPVW